MVIKQKLNKNDLFECDLHVFRRNKIMTIIKCIAILFMGSVGTAFSISEQKYILIPFFVLGGLYVIYTEINPKRKIMKKLNKTIGSNEWDITVQIDDDKIYYVFAHENIANVDPLSLKDVFKIYENQKYIMLLFARLGCLVINKEYADNVDLLQQTIKNNIKPGVPYFSNLKK